MIRSKFGDLAVDIPKALASDNPTPEPILVKADLRVPYPQFVRLLDELNRDGYSDLGLINEETAARP